METLSAKVYQRAVVDYTKYHQYREQYGSPVSHATMVYLRGGCSISSRPHDLLGGFFGVRFVPSIEYLAQLGLRVLQLIFS